MIKSYLPDIHLQAVRDNDECDQEVNQMMYRADSLLISFHYIPSSL